MEDKVKKLLLAVLVGWIFVSSAYASTLQIQFSGMNWIYTDGYLCDAENQLAGSGKPAESDPFYTAIYLVDGMVIGGGIQTSNLWFDSRIPIVSLPVSGTVTGAGGIFDLLTQPLHHNTSGGEDSWGLALEIHSYSITTNSSGASGTMLGSVLGAEIYSQHLPWGLVVSDPVTVSFSATIFDPVVNGPNYKSFTAAGTGEIAGIVPEPTTMLLLGLGLLGIGLVTRKK
jgi:hypothetical protein